MTTSSSTVDLSSFTTDAKFRTWGAACNAALTGAGLTQTADTGQINWTTVTKPVAATTLAGYEIWRFNDTLQATKPVFIRINYGSGGVTSGNSPAIFVQVGTGSNGSGTITGLNVTSPTSSYSMTNTSATPTNTASPIAACWVASLGYLFFSFGHLQGTGSVSPVLAGLVIIERSKDSAGAATGSAVGVTNSQYSTGGLTWQEKAINFDTATAYSTARSLHCGFLASYSLASGSDIPLYRHYIGAGTPYRAIGRVGFYTTDIADGTTFSATPFGSTAHTYRAWSSIQSAEASNSISNAAMAYIWE